MFRTLLLSFALVCVSGSETWAAAPISPIVNSLTDSTDANPGDGICADAPAGNCTLRAAIQECNAYLGGGCNTIPLPVGTIVLSLFGGIDDVTVNDLDLTTSLSFYGAGTDPVTSATIIDGGQIDRIFEVVSSSVSLTLTDLQIRRGRVPGTSTISSVGGAIRAYGPLTLTRTYFWHNDAGEAGGAIWTNGTLMVTDSSFVGNAVDVTNVTTADGGGALRTGGTTIVYNTMFRNNQSGNDGGAIENYGSLSVYGSTFTGNTARDDGGAIESNGTTLALVNTNFYSNRAYSYGSGGGGGVYFTGNGGSITGGIFANNTSNNDGGALYTHYNLTITDATFAYNSSCDDGGGVELHGSSSLAPKTTIYNSLFLGNWTDNKSANGTSTVCGDTSTAGGGLNAYNSSTPSNTDTLIVNSTFRENLSGEDGGGLQNYRSTMVIYDTLFEGNRTVGGAVDSSDGAGMANETDGVATLYRVTFRNNHSSDDAGGLNNVGSTVTIYDSLFEGNRAAGVDNGPNGVGGALRHNEGGTAQVFNTIFRNNGANKVGGAISTAIYASSTPSSLLLDNVQVYGNTSRWGGGVFIQADTIVRNSNIYANAATMKGGGLDIEGRNFTTNSAPPNPIVALYNLTVSNNVARVAGGGVYFTDHAQVTLRDSEIYGNHTTGEGGGLGVSSSTSALVYNLIIHDNTADSNGGGLAVTDTGSLTAYNLTITDNSTLKNGGGFFKMETASVELTNITIIGNTADSDGNDDGDGGGIYNAGSNANITNLLVANNLDGSGTTPDCAGASFNSRGGNLIGDSSGCSLSGSTANIVDVAALLENAKILGTNQPTYAPLYNSPAVEAGVNTGCPAQDQRGTPRPVGNRCDAGSVEYRGANLTLTGTGPTAQIPWNGQTIFNLHAANNGPYPATSATIIYDLPSGFQLVASSPSLCTDSPVGQTGATVTCLLGTLGMGGSVDVAITVRPVHGGVLQNRFDLASAVVDVNGGVDNSKILAADVQLAAELEVFLGAPAEVSAGDPAPWLLTVTNNGPDTANNILATLSGSTKSLMIGSNAGRAACILTGIDAECTINSLAVGESIAMTMNYEGTVTGLEERTATVTADELDPERNNNTAKGSTTIIKKLNSIHVVTQPTSALTDATVAYTASGVPVLQFTLSGADLSEVLVSGFVLLPGGDGNEVDGIRAVSLYVDADSDGKVDTGSTPVTLNTYKKDNQAMTLALPKPLALAVSETITYLVTYDFIGAKRITTAMAPQMTPLTVYPKEASMLGSWAMGLLSLLLLGSLAVPRNRRWVMMLALIFGMSGVWGCSGNENTSDPFRAILPPGVQFQVSLIHIIATSRDGTTPVEVGGLPLQGPIFTIR